MKVEFLKCNHCGNIAVKVVDHKTPLSCCGDEMEVLVAKTADSSTEKHVPVIEKDGNFVRVTVGSTPHPMTDAHLIEFIYILTNFGGHKKALAAGDAPTAEFYLAPGEELVAAYEYCNLHGLWVQEV